MDPSPDSDELPRKRCHMIKRKRQMPRYGNHKAVQLTVPGISLPRQKQRKITGTQM